uniref:Uncharacterized protein n=1 Tax=Brassica oleracea TaxID=3712 RepID=A0A3P6CFB3_BRAOL|nr:unnamed protein product [Brassica oleracea]
MIHHICNAPVPSPKISLRKWDSLRPIWQGPRVSLPPFPIKRDAALLLPHSETEAKLCREFPETENPSRRSLSPRRRTLSLSSPALCGGGGDRVSTFSYPCSRSRSRLRLSMGWEIIESRGSTWGSSSTLGIHRSCGGIHKNMEAPIGAAVKHGLGNHIESRGSTWGSSSTLGIHRSCGGIPKNMGCHKIESVWYVESVKSMV